MPDHTEPIAPPPDALRQNRPVPAHPKIDIFNDPFHRESDPTVNAAARRDTAPSGEIDDEAEPAKEKPASGLAEFDAPHAFASMLASGIGRGFGVVFVCMVAYGFTDACFRVSLLIEGWRQGGFGGFIGAILAVPGSVFVAPGNWFRSLGIGITEPLGVPYLLLFVSGLILAIRSEIHLTRLLLFYAIAGCIHAAAFLKMTNPFSILLWLGVLGGFIWLYVWYWRQQLQIEEEPSSDEV